jgi:Polysaccharide lyase
MGRRHRPIAVIVLALIALPASAAAGPPANTPGQSAPTAAAPPSISGTPLQGQTLSSSTGSWAGPSSDYAFQWSRCDASGAACAAIAGETSATHLLVGADVGTTMRVSVMATNKNGTSVATSEPSPYISASQPAAPATTTSTTTPTTTSTTTPTTTTTATTVGTTTVATTVSTTTPTTTTTATTVGTTTVATTVSTIATTTTTTPTTSTASTYSPSRQVYCFGDPAISNAGWSSGWLGDVTSNDWRRQGYAGTLSQRVAYDDSVDVMRSLGCPTIRAEIRPTDPDANGGTANQRAQVIASDSDMAAAGLPSFGIKEGQSHWYGFSFATNSGFVPTSKDPSFNWNVIQAFHNSPINGQWGPLANIQISVDTRGPADGSTEWATNPVSGWARLPQPRLELQVNGGDQNASTWPSEGPTLTVHRWLGPAFVPGKLYRVQYKITWGAHKDGAVQLWIDGVKWVDVTGVSNMWYSGSTVDSGMYVELTNYRQYDTSLPTNSLFFGGIVTGATQADVAVP